MNNSPLEFLASMYGNVVKYDNDGNPSIFVRFPKMKSSDLDPSLPDHTHPAFIINGVEQDSILLGKFQGSCLDEMRLGTVYSLPNMPPVHTRRVDELLAQCRNFGEGISAMTVADYGFLLLLAQKNGWDPKGNTELGHCWNAGSRYYLGKDVNVGDRRGWRGWLYECQIAHTTAVELYPDISPLYWKKIKRIGGTEAYPTMHDNGQNNLIMTLTGSGPNDWYLDGTAGSMCDLVGNQYEWNYGYRLVGCELQIMENNNAANPSSDLSSTSAAWKAILPNKADDGYTLVAPGTAGTLHWTWQNGAITLDTVAPEYDDEYNGTNFKDLKYNAANLPYIPYIVRELGLFPTTGSTMRGYCHTHFAKGERLARRGGDSARGNSAGLGCVYSISSWNDASKHSGVRLRALDI